MSGASLYQTDRYLGTGRAPGLSVPSSSSLSGLCAGASRDGTGPPPHRLTATSSIRPRLRDGVRSAYGIEAEVLAPPPAIDASGAMPPVAGLEPGYWLCVSRPLPYKNLDLVIARFERRPGPGL